ncbi:MAG: GNAT family N-acetyltransferase [Spirochaetales bacterium]|nr:GNAT family N-acetyltransferase [Spirochaetales bacterium]
MVYELNEISEKVRSLFEGWNETLIYSCLQQVMGKVFVTDVENPESAAAFVGCFEFFAGVPDEELVRNKPEGFIIMTPQNDGWSFLIEKCFPEAKRKTRYAIRKDTVFDRAHLEKMVALLPAGYEIKKIDGELYDNCLLDPVTADFVSSFGTKENFLEKGRGVVILNDGKIAAGASSYTRYREGIEIEVDTMPDERKKNLATVATAKLILNCLDENLYPSWDAQNLTSVHLAEKLGYRFDHEYAVYEVSSDMRTH